jgi:hypothetical protein
LGRALTCEKPKSFRARSCGTWLISRSPPFEESIGSVTYDGHRGGGVGLTGILHERRSYQVQANGSVGVGFDTSAAGDRGEVAVFW